MTKVIKEELKKFLESNEKEKYNIPESVGHRKGHANGEVYSYK
jgi:hypothetical protein